MVKKMVISVQSTETKAVFFSLKNVEKFPELFFGVWSLEYVSQQKHLGVVLYSNLGWSDQIDNFVKKNPKNLVF